MTLVSPSTFNITSNTVLSKTYEVFIGPWAAVCCMKSLKDRCWVRSCLSSTLPTSVV